MKLTATEIAPDFHRIPF